jgi:hypothetical protein
MKMNKLILIIVLIAIVLAGLASAYFLYNAPKPKITACTMEAKLCPDGSYVGRTGQNCEFAPCPAAELSGIKGVVLLGPTCPVERIPPDPQCADKPYKTSLVATTTSQPQTMKEFNSDASGKFSVVLPPGEYIINQSNKASMLPRCSSQSSVQVEKNKYTDITLHCDTGIR